MPATQLFLADFQHRGSWHSQGDHPRVFDANGWSLLVPVSVLFGGGSMFVRSQELPKGLQFATSLWWIYVFDFRRINIHFIFCRTNSVRDLIFV
jgi:hypothetical protein